MITKTLIAGVMLATLVNGVGIAYHYGPETVCAARMVRLGLTLSAFDYASADTATKRCIGQLTSTPTPRRAAVQDDGWQDWKPGSQ